MKVLILFALACTVVLAQRRQVVDRQQVIRRTGDQQQNPGGYGSNWRNNDDQVFGRGRDEQRPYGRRGYWHGPYGRRGPGPRRDYGPIGPNRGYGPIGPNRGYGPRGPNRGYGPRGPNRMLDALALNSNRKHFGPGMRGYGDEISGPYGGFYRGHGHGHRYFDGMCPTYCPGRDVPVCASDGRSYANRCIMQMEACRNGESLTVVRRGAC